MLLIVASVVFVAAGLFLIMLPVDERDCFPFMFIKAIGVVGVLFFGVAGIFGIRKLSDESTGLVIDENGICDNSSGISVGLIEWSDIIEIRTRQVSSTKFIMI